MRKNLLFILTVLIFYSCKKKSNDPQPLAPDITVYQTVFNPSEDSLWKTNSINRYQANYYNNQFRIHIDTVNWTAWERSPYTNINFNYSIQVDLAVTLDDPNQFGEGGFIYNFIDSLNYSVFAITPHGTFSAYVKQSGVFKTVFYITVSKAINTGNGVLNTILLKQTASQQEFIINGTSIGSYNFVEAAAPITVGLFAGSSDSSYYTPVTVDFDNFILKKIP